MIRGAGQSVSSVASQPLQHGISDAMPEYHVRSEAARPKALLSRAHSDFGLHSAVESSRSGAGDSRGSQNLNEDSAGQWQMRHGWDYTVEQLRTLSSNYYLYFTDKRHDSGGEPRDDESTCRPDDWRMRDRLKTVSAILAVCLNIGVDPPDVVKTDPCARMECWCDPTDPISQPGQTPMMTILRNLQSQYEQISIRTRYKALPDPTNEETKKYCCTLRKTAKDERILFHYNGHGVPKPTPSGEIWVFNKNYTQYIPVSLFDLQSWIGSPSLFVYDCSEAGLVIQNYKSNVEKYGIESLNLMKQDPSTSLMSFGDSIHLGACGIGESLPTSPRLPADLFTCCLTTPIEMAVRFFVMRNPLDRNQYNTRVHIPGKASERRTPLGELNWIFTAITDTIAWHRLPKPFFKKLFRQDLMVAALFRNFLLAQKIMRMYDCQPVSHPPIPSCHDHPLWNSWDMAIEHVLSQVPALSQMTQQEIDYHYQHSDFFSEQLTAFEVYLRHDALEKKEPEQLPIVLQVLLSQVHRLRALILLSKFLDLGPWAVNLALGIGIFPYVLKLLQSQAIELKPVMVFIWARILAVDGTCQNDLLKDNGYQYFVNILNPQQAMPIRDVSEHRAMSAFIIAMFCKNFKQAQAVAASSELVASCLKQIPIPEVQDHPVLRQWCCLCLSMIWKDFPDGKWLGIRNDAHIKLCDSIMDPVPEVRAAILHALTNLIGIPEITDSIAQIEEGIASRILAMSNDGSSLVRRELIIFFSAFVKRYEDKFVVTAYEQLAMERQLHQSHSLQSGRSTASSSSDDDNSPVSENSVFIHVWKHLLIMSVDPEPKVAQDTMIVVDYVLQKLLESPLGLYAESLMNLILKPQRGSFLTNGDHGDNQFPPKDDASNSPTEPHASKADGYFSFSMKRTASVAAQIKNLALRYTDPTEPEADSNRASNDPRDRNERASTNSLHAVQDQSGITSEPKLKASPSLAHVSTLLSKNFKPRQEQEKLKMPLTSSFLDWSVEYYREPQMRQGEAEEPGSEEYNSRLWRRNRNEKILEKTQKLKEQAASSRWDNPCGLFENTAQPMRLCFHQYDNYLVATDDRDTVRVWDWKKQLLVTRFSNGNPARSKITGSRFINEDDMSLLMTGSSDGVIKVFRNYDVQDEISLAASFRALTDVVPSTHNAGLVFDWIQGRALILVAGDAKVVRVWSAASEICVNDIPARSGSCVTSLTSDQVEGNVFVAGFGDGAIRAYDQREKPARAKIQQWKEHTQWITNIHLQRGGQRELLSASRGGEVKLWDLRMDRPISTIRATRDSLRSLSVHEHAPVFATGSDRRNIKVFNMNGSFLSSFEPHAGFLQSNRSTPIATTAFHPHRMLLACSALGDTHINLYSCSNKKRGKIDV